MHPHSLKMNGNRVVAEIRIDPGEIYGAGLPGSPYLTVLLHLDATNPLDNADGGLELRELRCKVSPFDRTYFATTRPARVNVLLSEKRSEVKDEHVYVEIPLDRERIVFLERESKGADVRLRLDVEVSATEFVAIGQTKGQFPSIVWGFVRSHVLQGQIPIVIPRSLWIEQILPQTGYGKIHVIELPAVSIENCAGLKKSFDALSEALVLQKKGFGDEAVGKCRIALEPFFKLAEKTDADGLKRQVPILEPSWETKLGKATYVWLNECFVGLKRPTNQPHHNTGSLFDQLEIQLLITVTTALIAYAVNTAASQPPTQTTASTT